MTTADVFKHRRRPGMDDVQPEMQKTETRGDMVLEVSLIMWHGGLV